MPVDTQQVVQEAEKLAALIAQHPAVDRYKAAQKAVTDDPEASRLMATFEQQYEALSRQQMQGMEITEAQQQQLERLQAQIVSHIKIKNLNLAQVDFVDLLRRVSQKIHAPLGGVEGGGGQRLAGTR